MRSTRSSTKKRVVDYNEDNFDVDYFEQPAPKTPKASKKSTASSSAKKASTSSRSKASNGKSKSKSNDTESTSSSGTAIKCYKPQNSNNIFYDEDETNKMMALVDLQSEMTRVAAQFLNQPESDIKKALVEQCQERKEMEMLMLDDAEMQSPETDVNVDIESTNDHAPSVSGPTASETNDATSTSATSATESVTAEAPPTETPAAAATTTTTETSGASSTAESDPSASSEATTTTTTTQTPAPQKRNIFDSELTEEEMNLVMQRIKEQQQRFKEFEERERRQKINKIKTIHPFLTDEEASEALKNCANNEDDAATKFTDQNYLNEIRRIIAVRYTPTLETKSTKLSASQKKAYDKISSARANKKTGATRSGDRVIEYVRTRLRLDDAIAQGNMDGWSPARIRAWELIDKNPNAYYYRFNAPNEKQKNGAWSAEEKALFMKRMAEVGVDGQWGIFSLAIPGRVGYQCANFYRSLVKKGEIKDSKYIIDDKGELRHLDGKRGKRKKSAGPSEVVVVSNNNNENTAVTPTSKPKKTPAKKPATSAKKKGKKGRKKKDDDTIYADEVSSGDEAAKTSSIMEEIGQEATVSMWFAHEKDRVEREKRGLVDTTASATTATTAGGNNSNKPISSRLENPLPGFKDPLTLQEIEKPAISIYGHVMGYENWLKVLSREPKNTCPFTKQPLHKRDLVRLTFENIEEYRPKIKNMSS